MRVEEGLDGEGARVDLWVAVLDEAATHGFSVPQGEEGSSGGVGAGAYGEALVFGVFLDRDFGTGVPAPGAEGLEGEGDGKTPAVRELHQGAGVAVCEFAAGHGGGG